jgi:hypothetical protein
MSSSLFSVNTGVSVLAFDTLTSAPLHALIARAAGMKCVGDDRSQSLDVE